MPPRPRLSLAFLAAATLGLSACRDSALRHRIHNIVRPPVQVAEFANTIHYAEADRTAPPAVPGRVVFMGDSIFDYWPTTAGSFFPGRPYLDRGLSGQTTAQMLLRFHQDVLDLHPAAVVILAGINDILGKNGPELESFLQDNLRSMVELAQAQGICVVLISVLPVGGSPTAPPTAIDNRILAHNGWLAHYTPRQPVTYLDLYTPMADPHGHLRSALTQDGLHPNAAGYALMAPLIQSAIDSALNLQK